MISKAKVDGIEVLLVDGVPQSTYPQSSGGYWQEMIPEDFKGKNVLLLGVGAGTIARLLLDAYPDIEITGVDNDSTIIMAAEDQFRLGDIKMKVLIDDGFKYIKETKKKFDLIIVDMWNGYWFPFKVLSPEFIKGCTKRLNKNGQVYINTPNLDFLAAESLNGLGALRDDIGRNIIYRFELTKSK